MASALPVIIYSTLQTKYCIVHSKVSPVNYKRCSPIYFLTPGIHSAFGDIQMHPLSPNSGSSSSHLSPHLPPGSRVQAFSPLSNPSPVTPSRPLLSSPHETLPTTHFTMPPPAPSHPPPIHSPSSPKFPSPPVSGVPGFMGRNFNHVDPETGDVFAVSGAGDMPPPPVGPGLHRPRANTEGGASNVPNPYEFPVHPGGASTLPRSTGSGSIPPPPTHSPPPLTQSSREIFARASRSPPGNSGAGHSGHHHHPGMSHRSFSTTHASTASGPNNNISSMRVIRSTSLLRPVSEKDPDGGPDYATVEPPDYYPPRKAATLGHYPPPPLQQQHMFPNGASRAGRNSDELSSFSEMTADNDSVQLSSGGHGHGPGPYRHPETGAFRPGDQRESVFSETSTEQSISSGSIREASPSGESSVG